ncbi:ABC transporter permease [Streptomyces sp. DT24]|uniref:ABC transporter permease n=1 Tax=unclassified Streptomyces TaxID=2593676 RepID=UPI0023BA2F0A|nr:ABC transporter permease [Streptomyces sp. AM 4-1-1]WEH34688.1 ABC transporter permease [Streptomyces sp. AM 4-1-1]
MSAVSYAPGGTATTKRGPLRGVVWLVTRQHRATILTVTALTVLTAAWIIHERGAMMDAFHSAGWPGKDIAESDPDLVNSAQRRVSRTATILSVLPIVLAVFIGAPLIAADQEQGTAQLVTTQSVPRMRWLLHKLGLALVLSLVPTIILGALFTWWWNDARAVIYNDWLSGEVFDNTGPVLPALTVFTTVAAIAVGVLSRRVLVSMVVTFGFAIGTQVGWTLIRQRLGTSHLVSYPLDADGPAVLRDSVQLDNWVSTADGKLFGWGTCSDAAEDAHDACLAGKGIVNNTVEYIGFDQMQGMQWTGAGILFGLTVVGIGFIAYRASRRPL